jgi:SAM-dependent methyltransferase
VSTQFDAEYFDRVYRDYARQNPAAKLAYYRSVIDLHRDAAAAPRIHDVGCAFGYFLCSLPQEWKRHGSDVSEYAITAARDRCKHAASFTVAPASASIGPDSFDIVTAFDILEHEPRLDEAGDSIRRQLRAGGLFVFVVPVYDGLSGPIIRALDRDATHIHKWRRDAWIRWASERFKVITWEGIVRYLLPGGCYLHLPTRAFRQHTPAILVACRRD